VDSYWALAILLLIGVLSYRTNRSLVENQDAIFRGQEVLTGLNELMVEILEAESAARGFRDRGGKVLSRSLYLTTQMNATVAQLRTLLRSPQPTATARLAEGLIAEKLASTAA